MLAATALVQAQGNSPATPSNTPGEEPLANQSSFLTRSENKFIVKAARANTEELAIARVAATRATIPQVRQLAMEIVDSHDSINNELTRLATAKTVILEPLAATPIMQKWNDTKAGSFDQDFVRVSTHALRTMVSLYEEAMRDSKDTDVTGFVREQISSLKDHLYKAEQLQKTL